MPCHEFWKERTKEINMDKAQVVHTIQGLLANLETIAAAANENAPKLILYCDLSYELSEAEDVGSICRGNNVFAEYDEILYHYGRYTARYQEFELGTISQEDLASQTGKESFDIGEFTMVINQYTG